MKRTIALALPWALLAAAAAWTAWDLNRDRAALVAWMPAAEAATVVAPGRDAGEDAESVRDPVCGMDVRPGSSHPLVTAERTLYFCTTDCRSSYAADPAAFASGRAGESGHVMRGLPTWMYQASVAAILLVSFGLFERRPRSGPGEEKGPEADPASARITLTLWSPLRRLIGWAPWRFLGQAVTVALFLLIIAAGLFGDQNPALNLAPLLTWTVWWGGLILLILYCGKLWCAVCPWDALATWLERLKFWGPRKNGLGLGLPWPRRLRNIWPAVVLFILLTWIELGMGVTMIPRATAWLALGMLGLAVASALVFDRKSFCRYGCLVGRISGLYALFSPVELRRDRPDACASCRTMDCYRGNDRGDGCPTFEFPRTMKFSTYCILCTECVRTCPHDNIAVRLRPWGADLVGHDRPRADEAVLAVILLAMTGFHGLTMTPAWGSLHQAAAAATGLSSGGAFALLLTALLVLPVLGFAALARVSAIWTRPHGAKAVFLNYAYALLPIALFYHLAHNAEHLLMEGPKVVPLLSDPMGRGWDLLGTAAWRPGPLITLEGLWVLQVALVLIGHLYGLWISSRTTRRLMPAAGRAAFLGQAPMLAAMVLFSVFSLWLLRQPMEMRLSAM